MVKLVALVFYENDFFFFNLHDTLTAVNLFLPKKKKLIEVRSYWFVSFPFDWRKSTAAFCGRVTHLHGILSLGCGRRNVMKLEPFVLFTKSGEALPSSAGL